MKTIFLFICLFSLSAFSQTSSTLKVGDEVEYFDGLDWIDSKIAQVGDKKYLVYLKGGSQTKWFNAEDVNPLYKEGETLIEKKTVIREVTTTYFKIGDLVNYTDGTRIITSEIIQMNSDNQCLIFNDNSKSTTIWVPCSKVNLLNSKSSSSNSQSQSSNIETTTTSYSKEGTNYSLVKLKVGDIVSFTNVDGKITESEIIQMNSEQSQVYYDQTQTATIWVANSKLNYIRSKN